MPIFHKKVGIPDKVIVPEGKIYLEKTKHAEKEAKDSRYLEKDEEKLDIPDSISLTEENVFEIETDENSIIEKIGCRVDYDSDRDLCMALAAPEGGMFSPTSKWAVKTVWINRVDDAHNTLDKSKYDSPDYF